MLLLPLVAKPNISPLVTKGVAMALTNAERQARWRTRLKAAADRSMSLEALIRERARELFAEWDAAEEHDEDDHAVDSAVIAMTDEDIMCWLDDKLIHLWEEANRRRLGGRNHATALARLIRPSFPATTLA